tara:strand:+ start:338 stop:502 length:165 start_codon:yes stop_codon:yes gene_type:complete
MAKCPKGQVYDQKLKKCRVQKVSADEQLKSRSKSKQIVAYRRKEGMPKRMRHGG